MIKQRSSITTFLIVFLLFITARPLTAADASVISMRLRGHILLQVESHGEAWYVNPINGQRHYLGRPQDAVEVMRKTGLGVSNKDFERFAGKAPRRLAGRILLKVEGQGEAYYVNPKDLTLHYLSPTDAWNLMRNFGIGISNQDLDWIQISQQTQTQQLSNNQTPISPSSAISKNESKTQQLNIAPSNSIFCNGKYWTPCSEGQRFYCPASGGAQCLIDSVPASNIAPPNTVLCNGKYWTACPSGQRFYCPSSGDAQCLIENNSNQESVSQNVSPPTLEQLTNLRRMCSWDATVQAICNDPNFMPGYYSNLVFRTKIDALVTKFFTIISEQQRQRVATEQQTLSCLTTPTPENERVLDPATQNFLRQIRCGTVTEADKVSYQLSRIKSSVDELKYRLDSKIAFPPLLLDPIQSPITSTPRWQIRWEGSGGTITDSLGGFYQFYCEGNTCRSY